MAADQQCGCGGQAPAPPARAAEGAAAPSSSSSPSSSRRSRLPMRVATAALLLGGASAGGLPPLRAQRSAPPAFLAAAPSGRGSLLRPRAPIIPAGPPRTVPTGAGAVPGSRARARGEARCAVDVGLALYDLQIWAKGLVDTQLTHLTPVSGAVLYGAGLLTSLSPCALSLVPLTMAYLTDDGSDASKGRQTLLFRASMFTIGLATSLSVLGLSATLAGKLFGSAGAGALGAVLPLTASVVAIVMGLNLLDLVPLRLPSFEATFQLEKFPPALQAFLLGATSALIASPCSTPVLASILGFVATSGDATLGAGLLFAYSLGYSTPILVAGVLSGAVTSFISERGNGFSWVTPATAALLISYGTYSSLNTLFPM